MTSTWTLVGDVIFLNCYTFPVIIVCRRNANKPMGCHMPMMTASRKVNYGEELKEEEELGNAKKGDWLTCVPPNETLLSCSLWWSYGMVARTAVSLYKNIKHTSSLSCSPGFLMCWKRRWRWESNKIPKFFPTFVSILFIFNNSPNTDWSGTRRPECHNWKQINSNGGGSLQQEEGWRSRAIWWRAREMKPWGARFLFFFFWFITNWCNPFNCLEQSSVRRRSRRQPPSPSLNLSLPPLLIGFYCELMSVSVTHIITWTNNPVQVKRMIRRRRRIWTARCYSLPLPPFYSLCD